MEGLLEAALLPFHPAGCAVLLGWSCGRTCHTKLQVQQELVIYASVDR